MNAYDLTRDPAAEFTIFVTAVLGIAIFIQMPSLFSAACLGTGYALFLALAGDALESGEKVNLTITWVVALAISFTSSHHAVISLSQRREINQINAQLRRLLQKDPLTGLLNKKAAQTEPPQIVRTAQKGTYVGKHEVLSGEASRQRRLSSFELDAFMVVEVDIAVNHLVGFRESSWFVAVNALCLED